MSRDVNSREHENLGYDLDVVSRYTGKVELKLEVKATAGTSDRFFISRNEVKCAKSDPLWRLVIVTDALSACQVGQPLKWDDVEREFNLEPIAWYGFPATGVAQS